MEYEEVLLIGGARDGSRVTVIKGVSKLHIPCIRQGEAGTAVETACAVSCIEYCRVPFRSDRGFQGAVFVFGDIDPMVALIEGYRKP